MLIYSLKKKSFRSVQTCFTRQNNIFLLFWKSWEEKDKIEIYCNGDLSPNLFSSSQLATNLSTNTTFFTKIGRLNDELNLSFICEIRLPKPVLVKLIWQQVWIGWFSRRTPVVFSPTNLSLKYFSLIVVDAEVVAEGGETGFVYVLSYQVLWYVHWQPQNSLDNWWIYVPNRSVLVCACTYGLVEAACSMFTYLRTY